MNNSSHHLLPTSEPLKMQRINFTLVFEGNAPIRNLAELKFMGLGFGTATSSIEST